MTAAIILAAGASTRLGSPKQLIKLHGETLLDRTTRIAHEAGCAPILVVVGASAASVVRGCLLPNTVVLTNEQWTEGMASSIRLGIDALTDDQTTGVIILSCDMPAVTPSHLRSLAATGALTASRYAGRNGIPAFFPRKTFKQLLALQGDKGARDLLRNTPVTIDLPHGEQDIDTPEDVAAMLQAQQPANRLA